MDNNAQCDVPFLVRKLNLTENDFTFLGEGDEHLVFSIKRSKDALRFKKTQKTVDGNDFHELLKRIKQDNNFLNDVAIHFLGDLVVDSFSIGIVSPEVLIKLSNEIEGLRCVTRRSKQINTFGIGCLCPNATTTFISRKARHVADRISVSSYVSNGGYSNNSSNSLQASLNGFSPSIYASSDDEKSFLSTIFAVNSKYEIPSHQNLKHESQTCHDESQTCHNESQTLHHESQTCHDESQPCNLRLSCNHFSHFSLLRLVCIEIKPKQGFVDHSVPDIPFCRFCVTQTVKIDEKKIATKSNYCPLDLFSGNISRMQQAVSGLFDCPQNNLKVFEDGIPVMDASAYRSYVSLLVAVLNHDLDLSFHADYCKSVHWKPPRSILDRVLHFQKLDRIGAIEAVAIYRHLVKETGCEDTVVSALQEEKGYKSWITKWGNLSENGDGDENVLSSKNKLMQKTQVLVTNVSFVERMESLRDFLHSLTAKDLSLMVLMEGPHTGRPPINQCGVSPFALPITSDVWFRCQVTAVDLVAKPASKIMKKEMQVLRLAEIARHQCLLDAL